VVIAIIGLLAAMVLAALSRARLAVDNTVCKSNLRQYVLALNCYAGDYRCYPPCYLAEPGIVSPGGVVNWYDRLAAYTRTKQVHGSSIYGWGPIPSSISVCPSYARFPCIIPSCYGYNNTGFNTPQYGQLGLGGTGLPPATDYGRDLFQVPVDRIRFTREDDVVHPSDMLAFGDALVVDVAGGPGGIMGYPNLCMPWLVVDYELGYMQNDWGGQSEAGIAWEKRRHNWRWNVAFCDAHTESHRTRELFDGAQDAVVRRWNRDNQPHPENLGLYRHP
jgi:type II secretory pathway pseudopilin PulG